MNDLNQYSVSQLKNALKQKAEQAPKINSRDIHRVELLSYQLEHIAKRLRESFKAPIEEPSDFIDRLEEIRYVTGDGYPPYREGDSTYENHGLPQVIKELDAIFELYREEFEKDENWQ